MSEPRYFPNTLTGIPSDTENLNCTLLALKSAIATSVELLLQDSSTGKGKTSSRDSLYTGNSGIALTLLRLLVQLDAADLGATLGKDIRQRLLKVIDGLIPSLKVYQLRPGHVSPLDSPVGPTLVYVLASLQKPASSSSTSEDGEWGAAMKTLENSVTVAVEDENLGGDEVLYGRAGLLWAMLNLQLWVSADISSQKRRDIGNIINTKSIEQLTRRIIEAGKLGARWYARKYNEQPLPLMWPWHDSFYLGAIHGVAGIITVLLQAPRDIVVPHLPLISQCMSALCEMTCGHDGYLPSSLPVKHRTHEYVQICHGSPGLLMLLATFRLRFPDEWKEDWEAAEALALEKVWKEGLVRKGIGICHGLSGNAWTLLLQSLSHVGTKETNTSLQRGLAILVHSTELPPLVPAGSSPYRTPDHPLSLFEGLAGAVCAWIDACIIIRDTLGEASKARGHIFGFPGLGGVGMHGYL